MKPLFYVFIAILFVIPGPRHSIAHPFGNKIDTEFYIPVEKSKLYVRMIGNAEGPMLINLHGGPGAFSGFDHGINKDYLEDHYLIAYLDQRGGGKSDECQDSTMLTMKQFVRDLDVVVDSLGSQYKNKKINLIGSSWGGTLGLLYMIEHQDKINSFACVSGKADGLYPIHAIINHEKKLINELLQKNPTENKKTELETMLKKLAEVEKSDFSRFFDDMNLIKNEYPKRLGFSAYWANRDAQKQAVAMGEDPDYYTEAHYTKEEFDKAMDKFEYVNRVFRNTPAYNHLNILDDLAIINKPMLVIQGEFDYAIGQEQGKKIYEALENVPKGDKELHILPKSAHNLNLENQGLYYKTVRSFIDKHSG